jgi:hypothetical protein
MKAYFSPLEITLAKGAGGKPPTETPLFLFLHAVQA